MFNFNFVLNKNYAFVLTSEIWSNEYIGFYIKLLLFGSCFCIVIDMINLDKKNT